MPIAQSPNGQSPMTNCQSKTFIELGTGIWQRADMFAANILANRFIAPQGQSYTERKYSNSGPPAFKSFE